ncbi:MAG: hypothetical protein J6S67_17320 [Methanobrevibacter sp.]|nr:hypothetical protein [Methanobrevibacter sp.]
MDKIQLIKQEIEKRINLLQNGDADPEVMKRVEGVLLAYNSILEFIDSLPEEPKCIYNRTLDERKKFCKYCSAACGVIIEEEPASEDLEEEIKNYFSGWLMSGPREQGWFFQTARHFAEWQKQHMKEVLQTEYEKGRFDMREELMKDAVEGVIDIRKWPAKAQVEFYDRLPVFNVRTGDKVKTIIVKTE